MTAVGDQMDEAEDGEDADVTGHRHSEGVAGEQIGDDPANDAAASG